MKQLGSIVLLTLGIFIGFIIAKVSQPLSINDMDNSNEPINKRKRTQLVNRISSLTKQIHLLESYTTKESS